MTATVTLYQLSSTAGAPTLNVMLSTPATSFLKRDGTAYSVLHWGQRRVFAVLVGGRKELDLYDLLPAAPWVALLGTICVGDQVQSIDGFVFTNTPYVMTYAPASGQFGFHSVDAAFKLTGTYNYSRSHAPAPTAGFTMTRAFVMANEIMFMGYSFDTGSICLYRIAGAATSRGGVPPLVAHTISDRVWAQGWTRFAFFTLGTEVFFLKTNIKYPNVNIDHVSDDLARGTSEVCSNMKLTDAKDLAIVEPFYLDHGHPHFLAYRPDGKLVLYRIHSDCQDWSAICDLQTPPNAMAMLPGAFGQAGLTFIHVS